MVIILFNTALFRSAFFTVSFRKLVFGFSVLSLNQDIKTCVIKICSFVLTFYKNSIVINNKLLTKILSIYFRKQDDSYFRTDFASQVPLNCD